MIVIEGTFRLPVGKVVSARPAMEVMILASL
jgi:hypothetical protein